MNSPLTDQPTDKDTENLSEPSSRIRMNGNGNGTTNGQKRGFMYRLRKFLRRRQNDTDLREAIEELITDSNQGAEDETSISVAEHERTLISNVLDLRDLPVIDVMVPRADVLAVDITTPLDELLSLLSETAHSRLPVYEEELDNVIGAVHMKDLVGQVQNAETFELRKVLRNVLVVAPSMRVMDLLVQMRQSRVHLAMVVDEFGGIDGLITINDLIEAIVGEIDDEHVSEIQPQLIERADGSVVVDARYAIEDFEEKYGEELLNEEDKEDVGTLGGFVNAVAGHLPVRGEIISYENDIEFEVIDADPRRINRIRIRNLPETTDTK